MTTATQDQDPWEGWTADPFQDKSDWEVGEQYILRAKHEELGVEATFLVTVTELVEEWPDQDDEFAFGFTIDTMLSSDPPQLLDAYIEARAELGK